MQRAILAVAVVAAASTVACMNLYPTQEEIEQLLEKQLRSVAGSWTGQTFEPNTLTLAFTLSEQSDSVHGTGTMVESQVGQSLNIVVRGTFRRPVLKLRFSGLRYEGRAVSIDDFEDSYTTVGGVADSVTLQGVGYSKRVWLLLQEAN